MFGLLRPGSQLKPAELFLRIALVVGLLDVSQLIFLSTPMPLGLVVLVLLLLSFALVFVWLKPPVSLSIILSVILVFLLLFLEQTAIRISTALVSDGAVSLEEVPAKNAPKQSVSAGLLSNVLPVKVVEQPVIQQADIHPSEELVDFYDAYMERRHWMQGLSPSDRQRHCEETAAFLIEEGLAVEEYSVAGIQSVDELNLIELVAFFNVLLSDQNQEASLDLTLDQLVGIALTDHDIEMLSVFVGLCIRRDIDRAMAIAMEEVRALQGESEFAATVLLAMIQAGTGRPIDLLLAEQPRSGPMTRTRINQLASNHWNRVGATLKLSENVVDVAPENGPATKPEEVPVVVKNAQPAPVLEIKPVPMPVSPSVQLPEEEPEPFLKITTNLGVVYVPDDEELMPQWVTAANSLQIRGYVALGDEIVILRMDGGMLRKDQDWVHEMKGYHYHFKLEDIQRDMVTIRAGKRELIR
ncbi:hypothetical protein P4B35_16870 [Pontiellaceae bacterium B12227]|nr:hypothetical protein [Pontiellaceae bacterium B12227]